MTSRAGMAHAQKPIATRQFKNKKTGRRIVAEIFEPTRVRPGWGCRVVIRGLRESHDHVVQGVDSMQALSQALQGIRFFIEQSGEPITWLDGDPGEYGLYKHLLGLDVAMTKHLEQLVEKEVTRLVHAKMRKRGAKATVRPKGSR